MKLHREKIDKVLRDFPAQGEQWQLWLAFHQAQIQSFQRTAQIYFAWANSVLLAAVVALVAALVVVNGWLWLVVLILASVLVMIWYYLSLYTGVLHELEMQTDELFEKVLTIETKPKTAVAKYGLDLATTVLGRLLKKTKTKDDDDRNW